MLQTAIPCRALLAALALLVIGTAGQGYAIEAGALRGIVIDDTAASLTGAWEKSTTVRPYVEAGYIHDGNQAKGEKSVRFEIDIPADGEYHVLISYTHSGNRDANVPVTIESIDGTQTVHVNQQKPAEWADGFQPLGVFRFAKGEQAVVVVSNVGTTGHVIADAVRLLPPAEFELAKKEAAEKSKLAVKPATKEKPKAPAVEPPQFTRVPPQRLLKVLTPAELDRMLREAIPELAAAELADDQEFLRRATLDLLGRPPTLEEFARFVDDQSAGKRSALIDQLLATSEYGRNWANYWSDTIGARQQEPELTFHDYGPLKEWLAEEFNTGAGWDSTVFRMVTAVGKVSDNPAATYIGFHQGNGHRLAGETTRLFLSRQIHCAECHDHPFVDMPQETFHGMAAFFARTDAKIPQLNSDGIEVLGKDKGEQKIDGKKGEIAPTNLAGESVELGTDDLKRRIALGQWLVSPDNHDFSRAYVNRIWARLLGRGFAEPVDELGELATIELPSVFDAVAEHFVATGFDHRAMFSLVMNSEAYQRSLVSAGGKLPFATPKTMPLRGDEVFDSLAIALDLENITPPRAAKTGAVRFPPPPKSTRDLVNDAFGYDPSFDSAFILRTMKQAMFMMNNSQIDAAIDASSGDTFLADLLERESDDKSALTRLYRRVLARDPTGKELEILLAHLASVEDRKAGFEDILWSLINSTEFTVRK